MRTRSRLALSNRLYLKRSTESSVKPSLKTLKGVSRAVKRCGRPSVQRKKEKTCWSCRPSCFGKKRKRRRSQARVGSLSLSLPESSWSQPPLADTFGRRDFPSRVRLLPSRLSPQQHQPLSQLSQRQK